MSGLSPELALVARNDQLEKEVADLREMGLKAVKLMRLGTLGVVCPACGAKPAKPCYGNGPMWNPHVGRNVKAMENLEKVLAEMADVL